MTYSFFAGSGGNSVDTQLEAVFGQWHNGSFVGGTTISFGTIVIPASTTPGEWQNVLTDYDGVTHGSFLNYSQEFDLTSFSQSLPQLVDATYGYLTAPGLTYALMLTNTTGVNTGLGLGQTNTGNLFTFGAAWDGEGLYRDWTFAQISVVPEGYDLPPVPEASTVAAMIGAAFIAALVGLRIRQRRQLGALPAAPVAA